MRSINRNISSKLEERDIICINNTLSLIEQMPSFTQRVTQSKKSLFLSEIRNRATLRNLRHNLTLCKFFQSILIKVSYYSQNHNGQAKIDSHNSSDFSHVGSRKTKVSYAAALIRYLHQVLPINLATPGLVRLIT
jgi:hypothetical protein